MKFSVPLNGTVTGNGPPSPPCGPQLKGMGHAAPYTPSLRVIEYAPVASVVVKGCGKQSEHPAERNSTVAPATGCPASVST